MVIDCAGRYAQVLRGAILIILPINNCPARRASRRDASEDARKQVGRGQVQLYSYSRVESWRSRLLGRQAGGSRLRAQSCALRSLRPKLLPGEDATSRSASW